MEEWKQIQDYPNYEVSNKGYVRTSKNKFSRKERILNRKVANNGYLRVGIWKNNKVKFLSVHRLVAIYFIPNPDNLPEINHLDGDKTNCNDWNLEWSTHKNNLKHASDIGLIASKERHGRTNLTKQDVEDIRNSKLKVTELCDKYNLHNTTIYSIKKKRNMEIINHKGKWYVKSDTGYKEILASTNPELNKDGVAKISDEFLQEFVKRYNDGTLGKEILVEYIAYCENCGMILKNTGCPAECKTTFNNLHLKVSPNKNTVSITFN